MAVDPDTVDRLLAGPTGQPTWRVADRAIRAGILATWLSSAVARGIEISDAAREYLDRQRRRVASLSAIGAELAGEYGVTVLKGPRIARYLPAPLLRQSGDVDLVAPDQRSLWACARHLVDRHHAVPQGVSVLDSGDGVHVGVALKWPAEEPHLDKPMGADITTFAFTGDLRGVPLRVAPPDEDDLCGLFAVAEERFQRRFRVKDLLDALALADALEARLGDRLVDVVCARAESLALAPELRQLLRKADEWVPGTPRWRGLIEALRPLAAREKARRRPDRPGLYRLRFGFPLDDRPGPEAEVLIHHREQGDVASTPLGTCLLVERPVLTEDTVAEAVDYARSLVAVPTGGEVP
jgi:hypothetical protein